MKGINHLQPWIPEIYLLFSVLFYWQSSSISLNPIAVSMLLVLGIIILWKAAILGVVFSFIFWLANIFMIHALISELNDFPEQSNESSIMLWVGSIYFALNLLLSSIMFIKWMRKAAETKTELLAEEAI